MEEKVFVSEKIAKVVKKYVPNDGLLLTRDLTALFSEMLIQVTNTAIQMYINDGVQLSEQK